VGVFSSAGSDGPPPRPGKSSPFPSLAVGVGRPAGDEDPLALVGRADIGRSYAAPRSHVPDCGQVGEDVAESSNSESCDVLQQQQLGSKYANGIGDGGPDPAIVILSFPLPGVADRLAGEPSGEHVDRLDRAPVRTGDVADVRHARHAVREDQRGTRIGVGHPCRTGAQELGGGHVQSAVAGAQ